jgi:K+-transporting ATPase ATPase A chain
VTNEVQRDDPSLSLQGLGTYALSLLISNVFMWLAAWTIVTLQQYLPLYPDGIGNMEPTLAFNTISSFTTNTNLQRYSGETGLSYFSQDVHDQFLAVRDGRDGRRRVHRRDSRAGGEPRDHARQLLRRPDARNRPGASAAGTSGVHHPDVAGNSDDVRGRGEGDNLEGQAQTIARGVTAGVVSIKQLGTNGGGYFGPNSAHPYESPTPLSNFVETWAITIPMAMV